MQSNLDILNASCAHPEPFSDPCYSKASRNLVISPNKQKPTPLQKANAKIRNNLTACAALHGKKEPAAIRKLIAEIDALLDTKGINNSEFTSFWEVNDVSYSIYNRIPKDRRFEFLQELVEQYCKHRHALYSQYGYSDTTLQVKADSFAHKRSGPQGAEKISQMLLRRGLFLCPGNVEDFCAGDKHFVLPDSTQKKLFDHFIQIKSLSFKWGPAHENKRPDFLIKIGHRFLVVEHKHMKEFGGGQNKQVNEIIDFVGQRENDKYISYVSFLDGILFNRIFVEDGDRKARTQRDHILKNLSEHAGNFFVNTYGFQLLLKKFLNT